MRRSGMFALALFAQLGCSHSEPFPPGNFATDQPFIQGPPARLTAQTGDDDDLRLTPDGSFVYVVNHQCMAFLLPHQARDSRWICPPRFQFVTDGYGLPVLSQSRRLAFVLTRQFENAGYPFYKALLVAPFSDIRDTTEVIPIPFRSVVDDLFHLSVRRAAWLRSDTLAILTDGLVYLTDPADTTRPRPFVRLALSGVSSMESSRDGASLYFKLAGDSRIQALKMEGRTLSTVFDFGADSVGLFTIGQEHLAAATAGELTRIHLGTGSSTRFATYGLEIRDLAMTADGSDIVVSAVDIAGNGTSDLYRLSQ
ncbi:MAG: hypothetical protein ABI613_08220 [Gemmatimonadota bacterium]